jgi:hypothetical protein
MNNYLRSFECLPGFVMHTLKQSLNVGNPARMLKKIRFSLALSILVAFTGALGMGQDLEIKHLAVSSSDDISPITAQQRAQWVLFNTVGPQALAGEAFSAGFSTLVNTPAEYGSHWDGFGKRAGADLSEAAVSHGMEAGLGAIWGEDPRYFRDAGAPFKNRLGHVFKMTFLARDRDGNLMPAYARFVAIPSAVGLSSTWRPASEDSLGNVGARIGLGVLGRVGTNAFAEFWPDIKSIFRRKPAS